MWYHLPLEHDLQLEKQISVSKVRQMTVFPAKTSSVTKKKPIFSFFSNMQNIFSTFPPLFWRQKITTTIIGGISVVGGIFPPKALAQKNIKKNIKLHEEEDASSIYWRTWISYYFCIPIVLYTVRTQSIFLECIYPHNIQR